MSAEGGANSSVPPLALVASAMPVSFTVSPHKTENIRLPGKALLGFTSHELLTGAIANQEAAEVGNAVQFGLTTDHDSSKIKNILPSKNGLAYTLIKAYNDHHALILRPDDLWLAIIAQFSAFVNGNAELLRASFVAHDGKQQLTVESATPEPDFGDMAQRMGLLLEKNVVDPGLREWAVPSFSTTTDVDRTTASVLLMATLKAYFGYTFALRCGIPKITLEGERADWVGLLEKIEKLKEYGLETTAWYHLLHPVLARFVEAFDAPDSEENSNFWERVAHFQLGGSGPSYYSGWVNAFMVFDAEGKWTGYPLDTNSRPNDLPPESLSAADFWSRYAPSYVVNQTHILTLDHTPYHKTDSMKVPAGYATVDVKLVIAGTEYPCAMAAGVMGIGAEKLDEKSEKGDRQVLRPVVGWWFYHKTEKS
ncbi:hypothetical protein HMN09_00810900 [Mycena chlorophos]|uniref:DUF4419 domain-containing protein n=1 Tax=Mycena chlorophos TaxID=658473 RepID=A0A8H6SWF2_MYCCL|nr:hypothetical protein HMN09_00810900 [Mycena chlorophos]